MSCCVVWVQKVEYLHRIEARLFYLASVEISRKSKLSYGIVKISRKAKLTLHPFETVSFYNYSSEMHLKLLLSCTLLVAFVQIWFMISRTLPSVLDETRMKPWLPLFFFFFHFLRLDHYSLWWRVAIEAPVRKERSALDSRTCTIHLVLISQNMEVLFFGFWPNICKRFPKFKALNDIFIGEQIIVSTNTFKNMFPLGYPLSSSFKVPVLRPALWHSW